MEAVIDKLKEAGYIIMSSGFSVVLFSMEGGNSPVLQVDVERNGGVTIGYTILDDSIQIPRVRDVLKYDSINNVPKPEILRKDIERITSNNVAHLSSIIKELGIEELPNEQGINDAADSIKSVLSKLGLQILVCGQHNVSGFQKAVPLDKNETTKDQSGYIEKEQNCGIILFAADKNPNTNVRVLRFYFPKDDGKRTYRVLSGHVILKDKKYDICWNWAFMSLQDMIDSPNDVKRALCRSGILTR